MAFTIQVSEVLIIAILICGLIPYAFYGVPVTDRENSSVNKEIIATLTQKEWEDTESLSSSNNVIILANGTEIAVSEGDRIRIVDYILKIEYDSEFQNTKIWFESVNSIWSELGDFSINGDQTGKFHVGDKVTYVITITDLDEQGSGASWTDLSKMEE